MEVYLDLHRLLYDPERGIPIETMHPEKPDWDTLGLSGAPPPGVKAIDVKRQFAKEQEDRLKKSAVVSKPKSTPRTTGKKTPPPPPPPPPVPAKTRAATAAAASATPAKRVRPAAAPKGVSNNKRKQPVSPVPNPSASSSGDEVEATLTSMRPRTRNNVSFNFVML